MSQTAVAILGVILTFAYFLSNVIFKTGHISARVEELEKWRGSIRDDMHEISDQLALMRESVKELTIVVQERTERRKETRYHVNDN